MNRSIPNTIQSHLKCGDNLVTHATHPSKVLGHDLVGFTIGRNFFLRSSSIIDLNGKRKLSGEEGVFPRECANFGPGKGGRIILQSKN